MNQEDLRALLRAGIEAAQNNNTILARSTFRQVLDEDPNNELAWMWLAQVVDTPAQRREALEQVLRINPDNERARDALTRMGGVQPSAPSTGIRTTSQRFGADEDQIYVPKKVKRDSVQAEVWGTQSKTPTDRSGLYTTLTLAIVAMLLIIGGLILLINQLVDDSDAVAPTAVVQSTITDVITQIPPTVTRTPFQVGAVNTLPPTQTPAPPASATPPPTETPVPEPPGSAYTLVFTSGRSLSVIDSAGDQRESLNFDLVEEGQTVISHPAYSPDGRSVVMSAELNNGNQELFIGSASNANDARQLTDMQTSVVSDAAWSPDGDQIVFAANQDDDLDLFIIDSDGGSATKLFDTDDRNESQPSFSPDGNYVAFTSSDLDGLNSEIYVMPLVSRSVNEDDQSVSLDAVDLPADNPNLCQITDAPRNSFSPAWSPDGRHIAFISNRNDANETDLFVMNADGSVEVLISEGDGPLDNEYNPTWSPDGRFIAVSSTRLLEDEERVLQPTDTPAPSPTFDPENSAALIPIVPAVDIRSDLEQRIWLVDVQNGIWYLVDDAPASEPFMLSGNDGPIEDIGFTCIPQ